MCTLVILRRPGHHWPLLIAANRDEMRQRTASPPARHWPDRPEVIAGIDHEAGGSWLGVNDHGVLAAVMNREGSLGQAEGKRSRGELVLEALDHAEAKEAAGALSDLHPNAYRPFNLIIADPNDAYWLRHGGDGEIRVHPIPAGLHMLSSTEIDDPAHPRIAAYLPRFQAAPTPDPDLGTWSAWQQLVADRGVGADNLRTAAMNLDLPDGFGTLCSSLVALPAHPGFDAHPVWLHADGPPDTAAFEAILPGSPRTA